MQEWAHFNEIEPIGPRGDDLRLGTLAMLLGNQHRRPQDSLIEAEDLFPWMKSALPNAAGVIELTPDEQVAAFDRTFNR